MPDEEFQMIKEFSKKNLEEINRRIRENDPMEVRVIPNSNITLRIVGFIDKHPIIHNDDRVAWDAYMDLLYKCHWCLDAKRVYLHGEQNEPDVSRRGLGSPCPGCCSVLTSTNYTSECNRFPDVVDIGFDVRSLMISAITAYLCRTIAPNISKSNYAKLLGSIGSLISLDKQALTVTFVSYAETDSTSGRLVLVNDQGMSYLNNKNNNRFKDKS